MLEEACSGVGAWVRRGLGPGATRRIQHRNRPCIERGIWPRISEASNAVDNRPAVNATVTTPHYENFPVASLLCPPALRPAVMAIYHFARTADDIADEGDATAAQRLADLRDYHADLDAVFAGAAPSARWTGVFSSLGAARRTHALPHAPLAALLDAFMQDCANPRYAGRAELLDYCRRSANPIGRLLLHLYGVTDDKSMAQSDAICSALQLINFWQDLSVDLPRGRVYLPSDDAARHGVSLADPPSIADSEATRALVQELCTWARMLMLSGAPLALRLPGRAGWELRFVVQGGLRVLERIASMGHQTIRQRAVLRSADALPVAWRVLTMRAAPSEHA
jgi:hydroxysqualene synthase